VPELESVEVILSGDTGHEEEVFHVRYELREGSQVCRKSGMGESSKSNIFEVCFDFCFNRFVVGLSSLDDVVGR